MAQKPENSRNVSQNNFGPRVNAYCFHFSIFSRSVAISICILMLPLFNIYAQELDSRSEPRLSNNRRCNGQAGAYHPNGGEGNERGGWVAKTAKVDPGVVVEPNAQVCDNVRIRFSGSDWEPESLRDKIIYRNRKRAKRKIIIADNAIIKGHSHLCGENIIISGNAMLSDNALVWGSGEVSGNAEIYESGSVWYGGKVFGKAKVYGSARVMRAHVFERARIYGKAEVSTDARVLGDARVYGDARVLDGAWVGQDIRVFGIAQISGNPPELISASPNAEFGKEERY